MITYQNCKIRPIESSDMDRVLRWRNSEGVRRNMYSDHEISKKEHADWFANMMSDQLAANFIFLINLRPVGLISFTNINKKHGRAYWAFYLGETDVPVGAGSAMEFFALDYAFLTLKLRKLCCEVFLFNNSVIKLHEKFGFLKEGHFARHYLKGNAYEDIVCLAKFGENWVEEREALKNRVFKKSR